VSVGAVGFVVKCQKERKEGRESSRMKERKRKKS
jgi:hypothetical protein